MSDEATGGPEHDPAAAAALVALVDALERQDTGKVRRFRPLEAVGVSRPG